MAAKAYGSITIVDIGDLGQLSVTPESNQPLMVMYTPGSVAGEAGAYNPNWATSNLVLKPVIYYGNKQILQPSSVKWQKKVNNKTTNILTNTNEIIDENTGTLTIKYNPFDSAGEKVDLITYVVTVGYTENGMGTTLYASGQITFGKITNAEAPRRASISGDSVFLIKSNSTTTPNQITLNSSVSGVTIAEWLYYDENSGKFVSFSTSQKGTSLIIKPNDSFFSGDRLLVRLTTNDETVYDEHTIIKVRDGTDGTSTVTAVLSNEDQMIPADENGNPIKDKQGNIIAFEGADTLLTIYEGSQPAEGWTINWKAVGVSVKDATEDTGSGGYVQIDGMSGETGYVEFHCTKTGYTKIIKRFSLVKVKTGADGVTPVIYSLKTSAVAVNKSIGTDKQIIYTPSSVVLQSYQNNGSQSPYEGIFKVYIDGVLSYTSGAAETHTNITLSQNTPSKEIVVELYKPNVERAANNLLDKQTIVITSDGATGPQGDQGVAGQDSFSFVLGNYSDVIPCDVDGKIIEDQNVSIPFSAYKGTVKVPCKATVSGLLNGQLEFTNSSTANEDGFIQLTFKGGALLQNFMRGEVNIELYIEDGQGKKIATSNQKYTWTKNKQAANAVFFQIYAPNGNIISNGEGSVTVKNILTDGSVSKSQSSCKWFIYGDGGYTQFATGMEATINANQIHGYASVKAEVTYNSKTYEAFFGVYDKTDPLQVFIVSTLGDKIVNSQGEGLLYARVYRNGEEIDPVGTEKFGKVDPTEVSIDSYWKVNEQGEKATLFRKIDGTWKEDEARKDKKLENGTLLPGLDSKYTWTFGKQTVKGKAIYITSDTIDKKQVFNVEVEF